jgi:meiotically up-regulated gene 157 (Mug157) protein
MSLPSMKIEVRRPPVADRQFYSQDVEDCIEKTKKEIKDPYLRTLFENCWPNTLDTTIDRFGVDQNVGELRSWVITGDISAMWFRDSTNQLVPQLN